MKDREKQRNVLAVYSLDTYTGRERFADVLDLRAHDNPFASGLLVPAGQSAVLADTRNDHRQGDRAGTDERGQTTSRRRGVARLWQTTTLANRANISHAPAESR